MGRVGATAIGELEAARVALSAWRREFGGRGRPIPDALWAMAAAAARVEGVPTASRALKVDANRLAARMSASEGAELLPVSPVQFVELGSLSGRGACERIVVELIGREGERVRVEIPTLDVVALARAFWSRGA